MRRTLSLITLFAILFTLVGTVQAHPPVQAPTALVDVTIASDRDLAAFRGTGLPAYTPPWGGIRGHILSGADPAGQQALAQAGLSYRILDPDTAGASYYLAYRMVGPAPTWSAYGTLLLGGDDWALLRMAPADAERLALAGGELQRITLDAKPLDPPSTAHFFPEAITPDPTIQYMMDQVTQAQVYQYDGDLSGEWPVTVGGEPYTIYTRNTNSGTPIQKATQFVGEHLAGLGMDVEYHQWGGSTYPNVIGEITGLTNPDDIYIICAHIDDMPSYGDAPGADDNASGVVAVMLAADILSQYQWGCTLRFAAWTGEEQGLNGSYAYAQRSYNQGENIVGVLNLDMIAWDNLGGPDIDLHADSSIPPTLQLAQLFADVVDAYDLDLIPEIVPNGTGASDHASFWDFGYTAILGIEDMDDFNAYYHTSSDLLQYLNMPYFTDFVKASVGTFAHMSGCLIPAGLGGIDGHVTAAAGGAPIADATVTMQDTLGHTFATTTDGSGYYTRTLLAGTYAVTASAYSYLPAAVSGVVVVTDTVTTQDFSLVLAPTHVVSGYVTEAGSGIPLAAEVTVLGTPLAPIPTNPGTGYYAVTLPEGEYLFDVTAPQHEPAERLVVVDGDRTENFELAPLPCILLVDDDNDAPDTAPYFTAALDTLGYDYDVFDTAGGGGPSAAELAGYSIVIWFSGDAYGGTAGPNSSDETNLATYLDGGGKLFLSSQDYLYDMDLTPFGQTYLGIGSYTNDSGNATTKYGVSGDPIGGGLGPYALTYPSGFSDYGDIVNAASGASVAFRSASSGGNGLDIDKDGGDWQTVFFGTDWVPIYNNNAANGRQVLDRILTWFGGCPVCEPPTAAAFTWTPLDPVAGEVITFTATASGTAPFLFQWAFGDGGAGVGSPTGYTYAAAGDYTVTLTATNACGYDQASALISVAEPPCEPVQIVTVTTAISGCQVTFGSDFAGTPPYTWEWDFGAFGTSTETNPLVDFGASGTYPYTLTAANACGADLWAAEVTVECAPPCDPVAIVTVTTDIAGCEVTFGAALTGTAPYTWEWDFGAWGTTTATNPLVDFGASGTYPYTLTAENDCGEDLWTDTVTVDCAPPTVWKIYLPLVSR